MADTIVRLARLSGATSTEDGHRVGFTIEGEDGGDTAVDCAHEDLEGIIQFLAALGSAAAQQRPDVTPSMVGATDVVNISPMEISDLGFMQERETGEAVLVMRMWGFDLGFRLSPDQLIGLKKEFDRLFPSGVKDDHDHHHHHH